MPCDLLATPATWDLLSKTGQAYFDALMEYLVKVLGVSLAFTVESVAPSGKRVCPVASWGEVGLRGGRCYDTRGTPCERLGQGQNGIYPDRLAERFPADSWVAQSGMRSYVGVPLLDAEGHPLGHLGVLDHRPMADPQAVAATLAAFALRCAAELGAPARTGGWSDSGAPARTRGWSGSSAITPGSCIGPRRHGSRRP